MVLRKSGCVRIILAQDGKAEVLRLLYELMFNVEVMITLFYFALTQLSRYPRNGFKMGKFFTQSGVVG